MASGWRFGSRARTCVAGSAPRFQKGWGGDGPEGNPIATDRPMSKAFPREDDGDPPESARSMLRPLLPPGVKNYVPQDGMQRLRAEREKLIEQDRPKVAAELDSAAKTIALELIDTRLK